VMSVSRELTLKGFPPSPPTADPVWLRVYCREVISPDSGKLLALRRLRHLDRRTPMSMTASSALLLKPGPKVFHVELSLQSDIPEKPRSRVEVPRDEVWILPE
jgi:hypothetical protein